MDAITVINAAINGVVIGMLLALPALAITLVFGIARFPNAASGDYMTLGAYVAVFTQALAGGSMLAAGLAAVAATTAVGLFFYAWVFRPLESRSNVSRLIASIGVAFALRSTITFFAGQDQYTFDMPLMRAWNFGGVRILPTDLYIPAISALRALALVFALMHLTPTGRRMRAVADNPELAAASGIRGRRVMITVVEHRRCVLRPGRGAAGHQGGGDTGAGLGTAHAHVRGGDPGRHRQSGGRHRRDHGVQHRPGGRQPGGRACLQDRVRVRGATAYLLLLRPQEFGRPMAAR